MATIFSRLFGSTESKSLPKATTANDLDRLRDRYRAIQGEIDGWFMNHPRSTRDLGRLQRVLRDLRAVLSDIERVPVGAADDDFETLRSVTSTALPMMEGEAVLIIGAKAAGPAYVQFEEHLTKARLLVKSAVRAVDSARGDGGALDGPLLEELARGVRQHTAAMKPIAEQFGSADLKAIGTQVAKVDLEEALKQFESELQSHEDLQEMLRQLTPVAARVRIVAGMATDTDKLFREAETWEQAARAAAEMRTIGPVEERVSRLSKAIEVLRGEHGDVVAGQQRVQVRRIATLKRLADSLGALRVVLVAANKEKKTAAADEALRSSEKLLGAWKSDLIGAQKIRAKMSDELLSNELGNAANREFAIFDSEFAGGSHATRDLARLGGLCERLREIQVEMDALFIRSKGRLAARNRVVVFDQRVMLETQYELIRAEQRELATQAP